jgi:hypothetical protein
VAPRHRAAGAIAVSMLLTVLSPDASAAAEPDRAAGSVGSAQIDLASQTSVVPPGGTFAMRLALEGVPADGSLRLVLHQRVRSRSELALSMEGDGLRSQVFGTSTFLSTLPTQPDGTRRLALSLDPANGGIQLRTEGVYPVEVIAQDAAGTALATLMTHLVVPPEDGDDSPPLGVAVVAEVDAPPALRSDGTTQLARGRVEAMAELVSGLLAAPDVPVTLAVRPETLDALATSADPGDIELVDAMRTAAVDRTVLALPYAEVSPDSLAASDLLSELTEQRDRGRQVVTDTLGVEPTESVWLAPPKLGADGLAALAFSDVDRVVVSDTDVEPLDERIISYSLAQPFLLSGPEEDSTDTSADGLVQAMATDPVILDRLDTGGSPGLVASRVLSEVAFLRLEQPGVARSVVLPMGTGTPARVVQLVLEGLGYGSPFAPMDLDEAFDHAVPLLDRGDNQVDRHLVPVTPNTMRASDARALREARAHLETYVGLLGTGSPLAEPLARHLLLATAVGLTGADRRGHIEMVESSIAAVTGEVSTPATFTLTLTAREGTVPLTIRNDSGVPLHVTVRLRSQKLEFPDGDTIDQVLTDESTRIDINVRALASGAFPLEVAVTSPDGKRSLATTRYTVRSTAVSGAGLVLSIGAGVFLIAWWASHWRRTRRSAKLVTADGHHGEGGDVAE